MLLKEMNNNSPLPLGKALPWVSLWAVFPTGLGGVMQLWVLVRGLAEVFFTFSLLFQF